MLEAEGYRVATLTQIRAVKQHPLLKKSRCLILHPAGNAAIFSAEMEMAIKELVPEYAFSPSVILIVDTLDDETRKRTANAPHCMIVEMPLLDAKLIDAVRASFMPH